MKVRINNIECRLVSGRDDFYEILKWEPCIYYGKLAEYIANGYEDNGEFLHKNSHSISRGFFDNPETCYVLSFIELNTKEQDLDMRTVGSRLVDLTEPEWSNFFLVYKIATEKILNKHFIKKNNERD